MLTLNAPQTPSSEDLLGQPDVTIAVHVRRKTPHPITRGSQRSPSSTPKGSAVDSNGAPLRFSDQEDLLDVRLIIASISIHRQLERRTHDVNLVPTTQRWSMGHHTRMVSER